MKSLHKCRVRGCNTSARARNLCTRHYMQIRRCGRILTSERRYNCIVIGCKNPHLAHKLCAKHYKQLVRNGKITEVKQTAKPTCFIAICQKKRCARGLCNSHHRFYLFKYVRKGYSWEKVDQIVAELNQNFLAQRNRVNIIRDRWELLQHTKEAYFKKEALRDALESSLLGPDEIVKDLEGLEALENSGEEESEFDREEDGDEF